MLRLFQTLINTILISLLLLPGTAPAAIEPSAAVHPKPLYSSEPANIRMSAGLRITSFSQPLQTAAKSFQSEFLALEATAYPQPPLAGFLPLVAISTSNRRSFEDLDWEHDLRYSYTGTPLNPPLADNFVIGILDSGSVVDLVAGDHADTLGVNGPYLTSNVFPIGGASGTLDTLVSQPLGYFAAGLAAIDANGQLDPNHLVGHSNTVILASPEISCGDGEAITAVVGTPMLAFFSTVIRNDTPRTVNVNGQTFTSPDVQLLNPYDPDIPLYDHSITLEFGGPAPATTASYYPDFFTLEDPMFPTLLSMSSISLPFGGAFFANIYVVQGEPGPTNPLQPMYVLVDTGAQSSIMSPAMAANLSLPVTGDFTVDVCGVGGTQTNVPGYYIDYVKINALGGPLEFGHAPFVVLDLESPAGGPLDGVLGMNFFWDRNIIFDPSLTGSGFLHVSGPVAIIRGDFNHDNFINLQDFALLETAWLTGPDDPGWNPACDIFLDNAVNLLDLVLLAQNWTTHIE